MKGRKLDITPYKVGEDGPEMDPKSMLANLLLAPLLRLGGEELLDSFNLANRIKKADSEVNVDGPDYARLVKVTKLPQLEGASGGFGIQEVELIRRILRAPEVELEVSEK